MTATAQLALAAPGIHPATPMEDYHRWPAASNSRLTKLRRSPAHLKACLEQPPEDTQALMIGRAIHCAILEPDVFDARYTVAQQCGATKRGDGQRCTNAGILYSSTLGWLCGVHLKGAPAGIDASRVVLTETDYATCLGIRDSAFRHPSACALLSAEGRPELSALWTDPQLGIPCKARFDYHTPVFAGGAIVDVKSTKDAGRREFERSIFTLGYHRQAAFYLDGASVLHLDADHFVFVAVEKEPPYAVATYRLTEGALDAGREQLRPLLQRYAECSLLGTWPAYADDIQDIALPDWAWRQIEDESTEIDS